MEKVKRFGVYELEAIMKATKGVKHTTLAKSTLGDEI